MALWVGLGAPPDLVRRAARGGDADSANRRVRAAGTRCVRHRLGEVRVRARGVGVERCHLQGLMPLMSSRSTRSSHTRCEIERQRGAAKTQSSPLLTAATGTRRTCQPVRKR